MIKTYNVINSGLYLLKYIRQTFNAALVFISVLYHLAITGPVDILPNEEFA